MGPMSIPASQAIWLQALEMHLWAARAHENAARLFASLGHPHATIESRRAAAEREACSDALARHPDWAHAAGLKFAANPDD
jgi:hypothetical protein